MTDNAVASRHWDSVQYPPKITRWWQSRAITRHINNIVCGEPLNGAWSGLNRKIQALGPFRKAVSVGCGAATKELSLVNMGIVEDFDLFEISSSRIEQGTGLISQRNLGNRMRYHRSNAFSDSGPRYDLVYWNNSLHHMMDVQEAIRWSRNVLWEGGWFVMDDFVGPTRWQWSDYNLQIVNRIIDALPNSFLIDQETGKPFNLRTTRPDPEKLAALDPSEAADSGNIMKALHKTFPSAWTVNTGGCIYADALADIIGNFDESNELHLALLESILQTDRVMAEHEHTHYAVAIAQKKCTP